MLMTFTEPNVKDNNIVYHEKHFLDLGRTDFERTSSGVLQLVSAPTAPLVPTSLNHFVEGGKAICMRASS